MLKQKILRYLSVLCSLLVMTGMTACAAQGPTESVSQSAESASRPAANIPWAMDSAPRATASSSSQALRPDSSGESSSPQSSSQLSSSTESEEEDSRFAQDVPQDIRRRVLEAEEIDQLDLTGLTFAERCQLVLLWETVWGLKCERWGIGMVDMTLDGCPELIVEYFNVSAPDVEIYELSGDRARMPTSLSYLHADDEETIWKREDTLLQGKAWNVFSTVFPDGTPGGIVERTTNPWRIDTEYYTIGGRHPLGNNMVIRGTHHAETIHATKPGEKDREAWVTDYHLYGFWDENDVNEVLIAEGFPAYNGDLQWDSQSTQEEFLASIKGTWLDAFVSLPRDPWKSPLIYPPKAGPDCRNYPIYVGMPWQEMAEEVQSLIDEYNLLLEQGDYDLPSVS